MADIIWIGTDTAGDWNVDANWVGGTKPANGDDVFFTNSSQDCDTTLDQSALALASLTIDQSYTGKIGTLAGNVVTYLQVGTALLTIGQQDGTSTPTGSTQLFLDLGSATQCIAAIHNSATTADNSTLMPIQITAAKNDHEFYIKRGKVGFANATAGETSTIDTIDVGWIASRSSDSLVTTGPGITLENWNQTGGRAVLRSATTVGLVLRSGELRTEGSGTHPAISVYGGELVSNSTGTITLLTGFGGIADFLRSNQARTLTTMDTWAGFTWKLDPAVVTLTNDPEPQDPQVSAATRPPS